MDSHRPKFDYVFWITLVCGAIIGCTKSVEDVPKPQPAPVRASQGQGPLPTNGEVAPMLYGCKELRKQGGEC